MVEVQGYHGSLVAFDGPKDIISTQLRLLPTSPQILILPSIHSQVWHEDSSFDFDARRFVRNVHEALEARTQQAHEFLRESTADSKRLVFLNGGTVTAQAVCLDAISRHETGGNLSKAMSIYNRLVRNGTDGLTKDESASGWASMSSEGQGWETTDSRQQCPITRAMQAADALDRQTAALQTNTVLDLTLKSRPRSWSLPIYGYPDQFDDSATPFYLFGATRDVDSSTAKGSEEVSFMFRESIVADDARSECSLGLPRMGSDNYPPSPRKVDGEQEVTVPPRSPSCVGEAYLPKSPFLLSPLTATFLSPPITPNGIELGDARLMDMRPTIERKFSSKRARSLDRSDRPRSRLVDTRCFTPTIRSFAEKSLRDLGARPPSRSGTPEWTPSECPPARYLDVPQMSFAKTSQNSTRRGRPPSIKCDQTFLRTVDYVDKGTDTANPSLSVPELELGAQPTKYQPLSPAFPLVEDLVIHFCGDFDDNPLEIVIELFKDGVYPIQPPPSTMPVIENQPTPDTPNSEPPIGEENECSTEILIGIEKQAHETGEYDPFACYREYRYNPVHRNSKRPSRRIPSLRVAQPPTPLQTPPPSRSKSEQKFHTFPVFNSDTAVTVQNALRSVLNTYFPSEATGYCSFTFPLLPDLNGIWKPIFREAEPGSTGSNNRRVDLIVAIGAQEGVSKDFLSAISGRLEKLGDKSSGITRSGRLDLKYLIANAMQSFTAQPLTNQAHDNPFTNSTLLATLVIPHLEAYLAAHSATRFLLLEYPAEHLPTVLALQKLVGVDLVKVAGIVDSNNSDSVPFSHRGQNSITSVPTSPLARNHPFQFFGPTDGLSSKANFLLECSASESEITKFVSAIRRILVRLSQFYIPDQSPRKSTSPRNSTSPRSSTRSTRYTLMPNTSMSTTPGLAPHVSAKLAATLGINAPPLNPFPQSSRPPAPSPLSTERGQLLPAPAVASRRPLRARDQASLDNGSFLSAEGEAEDSDIEFEERRLMPLFGRSEQRKGNKGNTRKALKWLGLA